MGTITRPWLVAAFLVALLATPVLAACGGADAPEGTPVPTFTVSLLVHLNEDDERWFRDVEVSKGTNAYEFTELVTEGDMDATWYPAYRTHFVDAIMGLKNANPNFWLIYQWSESQGQWEPLSVGADRFSLMDDDVLAWAYADTTESKYHEKLTEPLPSGTQ